MRDNHCPGPGSGSPDLRKPASAIQDEKRRTINGGPSRWPDRLGEAFAALEKAAAAIPYAALDLEYLRDPSLENRSFAYVISYDTFVVPRREASGARRPAGQC